MKHVRYVTSALVLLLACVMVVPAFAQSSATVTITEDTINSSYRVSNPYRRSITNAKVDLQPDQAVITATITLRNKNTGEASATIVPAVSNGRVTWTVTAATWNGTAATGETLTAIKQGLADSWRSYVRGKVGANRVSTVTITDTDITFTFASTR